MGTERRTAILSGTLAVAFGQALLVALAPLSRAGSPGVTPVGIALLSADSEGYLALAESATWLGEAPWNRLVLVAILRVGWVLGDAPTTLVAVQTLALVIAASLVHRLTARAAGNAAGAIASLAVAANPLTAQWVRFVLSETLMIALVLIVLWAALELGEPSRTRRATATLLTTAIIAAFLRPNGVLVLGSALTVLALRRSPARRSVLLVSIWVLVGGGLLLGLLAAGQPSERSLTEQIHAGVIIEGTEHVLVTRTMPEPRDPSDVSMAAGVRYAAEHPVAMVSLAITRIAVEVAQVRRHYPVPVNVGVGLMMVLLLAFATVGARQPGMTDLRRTTVVLVAPILVLVGLTFATPEGRYGWVGLVALGPLAAIGFARTTRSTLGRRTGGQSETGPEIAR